MKKIKYLIHGTALAACLLIGAYSSSAAEPKIVEIHASDDMKFDVTAIEAAPGQTIKLTLINKGTMPKESMGHNFVLLKPTVDMVKFLGAAAVQARNNYVPPRFQDEVIAHTKILGPGESDTIEFTAPDKAGDYEFVCSFPGHAQAGMKGILTVK